MRYTAAQGVIFMILPSRLLALVFLVLLLICALFQSAIADEVTQITLTWDPVDITNNHNIAGYRVYCVETGETDWKQIGELSDATFTYYPVTYGKTYSFFVTAFDSNGQESYPSNEVSWPIQVFALKEGEFQRGVVYPETIYTIEWYAAPKAEKFRLLYSTDNGLTWSIIEDGVTGRNYQWTVPLLPSNRRRCLVRVVGFDSEGVRVGAASSDGPFAVEVVRLMTPAGGETLVSSGQSPQPITWQTHATKDPVASIDLYYTLDGVNWILIETPNGYFEKF